MESTASGADGGAATALRDAAQSLAQGYRRSPSALDRPVRAGGIRHESRRTVTWPKPHRSARRSADAGRRAGQSPNRRQASVRDRDRANCQWQFRQRGRRPVRDRGRSRRSGQGQGQGQGQVRALGQGRVGVKARVRGRRGQARSGQGQGQGQARARGRGGGSNASSLGYGHGGNASRADRPTGYELTDARCSRLFDRVG